MIIWYFYICKGKYVPCLIKFCKQLRFKLSCSGFRQIYFTEFNLGQSATYANHPKHQRTVSQKRVNEYTKQRE